MGIKDIARRVTPAPVWTLLRLSRMHLSRTRLFLMRLQVAREALVWRCSRKAVRSRRRLQRFKDRYLGRRCFILGNGPSLRKTDLSLLRDEITFGLNRIYLAFDDLGFATNFLVSINRLVIEQCADEIARLPCTKFVNWHARKDIDFTQGMVFLRSRYDPFTLPFYHDPRHGVFEGSTVTYVAMQLAFYMGFGTVVLVGVDHTFTTKGPAHKEVMSTGDDPDHFHPAYFGKGFRWQLPDLEDSERHYRIAKEEYEKHGRQIVDATIDGKLDVFPKVDYYSLF